MSSVSWNFIARSYQRDPSLFILRVFIVLGVVGVLVSILNSFNVPPTLQTIIRFPKYVPYLRFVVAFLFGIPMFYLFISLWKMKQWAWHVMFGLSIIGILTLPLQLGKTEFILHALSPLTVFLWPVALWVNRQHFGLSMNAKSFVVNYFLRPYLWTFFCLWIANMIFSTMTGVFYLMFFIFMKGNFLSFVRHSQLVVSLAMLGSLVITISFFIVL